MKVGDKVKDKYSGKQGLITEIYNRPSAITPEVRMLYYVVRLDDSKDYVYLEYELEVINEAT